MKLLFGTLSMLFIVSCGAGVAQPASPRYSKGLVSDHVPAVLVRRPPRSSGGLDGDAAGWVLFRQSHRLEGCYEEAGGAAIGTGVVYLLVDVDPGGDIDEVMVGHSDIRSSRFERCLIRELQGIVMPRAAEATTLQAHLVFGASSAEEGRRMLTSYRESRAPVSSEPGQPPISLADLRSRIQDCYERVSRRQPGLRGRMVLELTLEEDGSVTNASVSEDGLNGTLNHCVLGAVRDLRLMGEYASAETMRYPVLLEPGQ